MNTVSLPSSGGEQIDPGAIAFYRHVLEILDTADLRFLVGGAYAFNHYTGIGRYTKDLDLFIRRRDYERVSEALNRGGYPTDLTYPHWLAKTHSSTGVYVDIIFSSGNGIAEVDDVWFAHAEPAQVLDLPARLCPVEEMIWSKAFVMERERFDGADVAHLLRACGDRLDWERLRWRFGPHWRVLLSHFILFGFIYPGRRDALPVHIMEELLERLRDELRAPRPEDTVCAGTLLSREQYLPDIEQWRYQDARLLPAGNMSAQDTALWTKAIENRNPPR
ncbi:MAG TPA: hypothetical protein VEC06_13200 [Paucimonas sp.]|nr:hypothetical protein [Paucimonas sp.]